MHVQGHRPFSCRHHTHNRRLHCSLHTLGKVQAGRSEPVRRQAKQFHAAQCCQQAVRCVKGLGPSFCCSTRLPFCRGCSLNDSAFLAFVTFCFSVLVTSYLSSPFRLSSFVTRLPRSFSPLLAGSTCMSSLPMFLAVTCCCSFTL